MSSRIQSKNNWCSSCAVISRIRHFLARPKMNLAPLSRISDRHVKWVTNSSRNSRKWVSWMPRVLLRRSRIRKLRRKLMARKPRQSAEFLNSSMRIMRDQLINPRNAQLSFVKVIRQRRVLSAGSAKKTEIISVCIRWKANYSMFMARRRSVFQRIARLRKSNRFSALKPERHILLLMLSRSCVMERCSLWPIRI